METAALVRSVTGTQDTDSGAWQQHEEAGTGGTIDEIMGLGRSNWESAVSASTL
ncbi:unnamed protein product [Staurois parvus]|uniref:Uncharacterized protein n=1 Tax=Staurois parvus TaxID=386267 RepID=A0ABN9AS58_9NEOB|nr:unnamed protein product [Staurois parvus]